jgi:hypothetical protein
MTSYFEMSSAPDCGQNFWRMAALATISAYTRQ